MPSPRSWPRWWPKSIATSPKWPPGSGELVGSAARHVTGTQHVGITLADRSNGISISTVAASHRYLALLDKIQHHHQQGPCVSAAWQHATIRIETSNPTSGGRTTNAP